MTPADAEYEDATPMTRASPWRSSSSSAWSWRGLYFSARPGPTVLDRWAFAAIPAVHHSGLLLAVTRLGSPFVVVAAAVAGSLGDRQAQPTPGPGPARRAGAGRDGVRLGASSPSWAGPSPMS